MAILTIVAEYIRQMFLGLGGRYEAGKLDFEVLHKGEKHLLSIKIEYC